MARSRRVDVATIRLWDQDVGAVSGWKNTAKAYGVNRELIKTISATHRLNLAGENR